LKYKIPFNRELFYQQTEITLPYVFSDAFFRRKEAIIWSIIFLLLGISILISNRSFGALFLAFSAIAFYNLYWKNDKYKELKNDYMSRLKAHMNKENKIPKHGVFEFKEDSLVFSDDYSETITEWRNFQEYKIVKSNLLLMRNKEQGDIMVIGESEIGKLEFQKVISFVKRKFK
jgi:hypothetical protein